MNVADIRSKVPGPVAEGKPAATAAPSRPEADASPGREELEREIKAANDRLAVTGQQLAFEWDRDSQRIVVSIVDAVTQEVIRQIPSEDAIALARRLSADPKRLSVFA